MDINKTVTNRIEQEKAKRRIPWVAIAEAGHLNSDQLKRRRDGQVNWTASEVADISTFLQVPILEFFQEQEGKHAA